MRQGGGAAESRESGDDEKTLEAEIGEISEREVGGEEMDASETEDNEKEEDGPVAEAQREESSQEETIAEATENMLAGEMETPAAEPAEGAAGSMSGEGAEVGAAGSTSGAETETGAMESTAAPVPEEPTAAPEEPTAVPEEPTAVPEEPTAVPEESTVVPETSTAVQETTAAVSIATPSDAQPETQPQLPTATPSEPVKAEPEESETETEPETEPEVLIGRNCRHVHDDTCGYYAYRTKFSTRTDNVLVKAVMIASTQDALPAGAHIVAQKVEDEGQLEEIAGMLSEEETEDGVETNQFQAFDIWFEYEGAKYEPEEGAKVTVDLAYSRPMETAQIAGEEIAPSDMKVLHIKDGSEVEDVTKEIVESQDGKVKKATFETESFSIFVLTGVSGAETDSKYEKLFTYEDDEKIVKVTANLNLPSESDLGCKLEECELYVDIEDSGEAYEKMKGDAKAAIKNAKHQDELIEGFMFHMYLVDQHGWLIKKDGEEILREKETKGKVEIIYKDVPQDGETEESYSNPGTDWNVMYYGTGKTANQIYRLRYDQYSYMHNKEEGTASITRIAAGGVYNGTVERIALGEKCFIVTSRSNTVDAERSMNYEDWGGEYSVECFLSNFTAFVRGNYASSTHVAGPVCAGNDIKINNYQWGGFANAPHDGSFQPKLPSYAGGNAPFLFPAEAKDTLGGKPVYYGAKGVDITDASHIIKSYADRKDYFDMEKAFGIINERVESLAIEAALPLPDGPIMNGGIYKVDSLNRNISIQTEESVKIIDLTAGRVTINKGWNYMGANTQNQYRSDGINAVYVFPNATEISVNAQNNVMGHIVAPKANVIIGTGNFNGSIIAQSVNINAEHHIWLYNGDDVEPEEKPVSASIEVIKKVVRDNALAAPIVGYDTFYFALYDGNGNARVEADKDGIPIPVQSIKVGQDGTGRVTFDNLAPGNYMIYETDESGAKLEVNGLKDQGYSMIAGQGTKVEVGKGPEQPAVTIWNHMGDVKTGRIVITKQIVKGDSSAAPVKGNATFYFALYGGDGQNKVLGPVSITVNDQGGGTAAFENIPVGRYMVYETDENGSKLTTLDNYNILDSDGLLVEIKEGEDGIISSDAAEFRNEIKEKAPAKLSIMAAKYLTVPGESSRKLVENEFSFRLSEGQNELEVVSNDAAGNINFSEIQYTETGEHTYTLKEVIPDKKDPQITYDETEYTIKVKVTQDNITGNLVAETENYKGEGKTEGLQFTNKYEEPEEPTSPTDPTNPSNPTEPTEPTNPSNPTEPTPSGNHSSEGGGTITSSTRGPGRASVNLNEISDTPVPLAAVSLPEPAAQPIQILDEDVPLAGLPKTGDKTRIAAHVFLLSLLSLAGIGITRRRKES